ncbi:MAG TPA: riboflavin synthase [Gemmatimonadaceae bacterium]|nr:riboflavin synthase [Gemmatimonadaceae bacterium]
MFTGLVTHVGEVLRVADGAAGREFSVSVPWTDIVIGESIAVQGACLTVMSTQPGEFSVAAVKPTVERTTVGAWRAGRRVNLERALRANDRMGGHLVQGHVDGVATVHGTRRDGAAMVLDVELWDNADALCIPQGSIALDGVSLTILALPSPGIVSVAIIEHTRMHTTLGERRVGDRLNVELDVVGKYVRQIAAPWSAGVER